MKVCPIIEPHAPATIEKFAKKFHMTKEQAGFIDFLRSRYIGFEYDYVKENCDSMEGEEIEIRSHS